MNIELKVNLDVHAFSGSGITYYEAGLTNCILHKNKKGEYEVTQRPSIDISEDSTTIPALNNRARGIYYWEKNTKLYIVHDNDLYEGTQNSVPIPAASGTFSTGTERCQILETVGTPQLVIIDSENNKLWVMTTAKILDQVITNVPLTIVQGGAILDGYLFIMDEDGVIYNSEVDAPQTIPATGFLEAERENDKGVYLGKHNEHIVAFGTRTIEFFYDAGNRTGSPLNRRDDIMYNTGCADGLGVWENGDVTYFVGSNTTGQVAVYKLENFQITPISSDSMNSYLTQGLTQEGLRIILNGWSAMGHDTIIMTIYILTGTAPGTITPKVSFSYDSTTGIWGFCNTDVNGHSFFPIMAFTKRTGGQNATESARTGEGIMSNGDIFNVNDKLIPVDTLLGSDGIVADGVLDPDIVAGAASDIGSNIGIKVRTGMVDGGIRGFKFQNFEYLLMNKTASSQTLSIYHLDENDDEDTGVFELASEIDASMVKKESYQGGRFDRRNYQLEYSGNEQIFLERFGADLEAGD